MYCGDETGSFIGEIGSHACRFGYGGEDNPKMVTPSYVVSSSSKSSSASSSNQQKRRMARFSSLHPPKEDEVMESILRMPSGYRCDDDDNNNSNSSNFSVQPITNPNSFLRQGELVENWNNMETAWETSMNTLRARDTLKHTKGGTPYSKKQNHSSGVTSTTVTGGGGEDETNGSSGDGRCVHPILAVMPGYSEYSDSNSSSSTAADNNGVGSQYNAATKRNEYIKYTELIMESLDASSVFLAPAPMLAAFSLGRQTALMVDIGAGGCCVTPIVDGLILKHSQRRNGRGGDWLGDMTWKALQENKKSRSDKRNSNKKEGESSSSLSFPAIKPRYMLGKKAQSSTNSIFQRRSMNDLMYEIRTEPFIALHTTNHIASIRIPFVSTCGRNHDDDDDDDDDSDDDDVVMNSPTTGTTSNGDNNAGGQDSIYHLPDGTPVDLASSFGRDLCQLPELLFAETTTLPFQHNNNPSSSVSQSTTLSNEPLHKLIHESLLSIGDVDARKELAQCICLVGGSSLLPNIETRLSQELSAILPSFVKPKVLVSRVSSVERSCASWIGASILTSLGSFQQLWLSKTEYEEYGTAMAIQRFP
jgi:actin-like protein 6A